MNAKGFMTIDSADVSRWENGMIPRGAKLRAYAATLGMTTDEIIDIYEGIPDQGNAAQDRDGD
jgi:transcriptional regulator with XRE-family HTH domain